MKQNTAPQKKLNAGAQRLPVSVEMSFTNCNVDRQHLFAVRPGIPAWDALSEASCILDSVRSVLDEAGMETMVISPSQAWLLFRAVDSAKAVIDSVSEGLEQVA